MGKLKAAGLNDLADKIQKAEKKAINDAKKELGMKAESNSTKLSEKKQSKDSSPAPPPSKSKEKAKSLKKTASKDAMEERISKLKAAGLNDLADKIQKAEKKAIIDAKKELGMKAQSNSTKLSEKKQKI